MKDYDIQLGGRFEKHLNKTLGIKVGPWRILEIFQIVQYSVSFVDCCDLHLSVKEEMAFPVSFALVRGELGEFSRTSW